MSDIKHNWTKDIYNGSLLDKVTFQLKKREPFYSRAKWTVNGVNLDVEELAGMVNHSK